MEREGKREGEWKREGYIGREMEREVKRKGEGKREGYGGGEGERVRGRYRGVVETRRMRKEEEEIKRETVQRDSPETGCIMKWWIGLIRTTEGPLP